MDSINNSKPASQDEREPVPLGDRVVLWMFLLGFVLFGLVLLGDLVAGFFR